jgi:hypothetical protein
VSPFDMKRVGYIAVNKIFTICLLLMKSWHEEEDNKQKQAPIHMAALIISSIAIFMLGLIATTPSMIYAQNTTTSTPSNTTTVEGHATNTTGTPLNTTSSAPHKPADSGTIDR